MKKHNFQTHELEIIRQTETHISTVLKAIEIARQFKLGDYLIGFYPRGYHSESRSPVLNSYGAPKKYQVIHVDSNDIPYVKELNKAGKPSGNLITLMKQGNRFEYESGSIEFEVDPDYADSIIMADEENYDASLVQRLKGDLFKEITAHNKSIKVKTIDSQMLISFLQTLKVGDLLWRSTKTSLIIIELHPIPLTHNGKRLAENVSFGTVVDSKGKEHDLNADYFRYSAFYTAQPRSYNELKDPK
jgi:hypothetical protein